MLSLLTVAKRPCNLLPLVQDVVGDPVSCRNRESPTLVSSSLSPLKHPRTLKLPTRFSAQSLGSCARHSKFTPNLSRVSESPGSSSSIYSTLHCVRNLRILSACYLISGEPGLASARNSEPEHGAADPAHLRRGPAADIHPDAPRLLPPFRQQRDVPAGGETGERAAEPVIARRRNGVATDQHPSSVRSGPARGRDAVNAGR